MRLRVEGLFKVVTFATAALRVLGATGFLAVARLRLTGAFFAAVLTVAVDAGIWMLAFVTLIL